MILAIKILTFIISMSTMWFAFVFDVGETIIIIEPIEEINQEAKEPTKRPITEMSIRLSLPDVDGAKKTFMDYRAITREGSAQLNLQKQAYTDEQGFRRIGEYYLVALATYYVKEIGDTFEIFFDNKKYKLIAGDIKNDKHTDKNNQYHLSDGSIVEFIIDTEKMDEKVIKSGDCSWLIGHGAVTGIRRIG